MRLVTLVLLNVTLCVSIVSCKKLSEYFPTNEIRDIQVRLLVSEMRQFVEVLTPKKRADNPAGAELWSRMTQNGGRLNLTLQPVLAGLAAGVCNTSGICSDLLGMVQRGEVETAGLWADPSSLPFDTIDVGPTIADGQLIIVTGRDLNEKNRTVLATDVYKQFSVIFSVQFLMTIYIVSLLIAFMMSSKKKCMSAKAVIKNFIEVFYQTLAVIVDQEYFTPPGLSAQILWLSTNITILVITQGYVFNLISTDLVNIIPKPQIDSLEDLEKPEHLNKTIIFLKGQVAQSQFESEPIGSIQQRLLLRKHPLDLNEGELSKIFEDMQNGMDNHSAANIISKATFDMLFRLGTCAMHPQFGNLGYISKTEIGRGSMVYFSRKILPRPMALKYLDHRRRLNVEGGLVYKMWNRITEIAWSETPYPIRHATYKCIDGVREKESYEKRLADIKLLIPALSTTLYLLFGGMLMSLLVVVCEIDVKRCLRKVIVRSRRRLRKPNRKISIKTRQVLRRVSPNFILHYTW